MGQRKHQLSARAGQRDNDRWRQQETRRIQRRMALVRNQMDLIEILSNFWPLDNMEARAKRLSQEMEQLDHTRKLLTH